MNIIAKLIKVGASLFIFVFFFWLFFQFKDITSKLMFLPLLICGSLAFWHNICDVFENVKLRDFLYKLYALFFFLFWFGMLFTGVYTSIVNKEYGMIIFIIPFILVGIRFVKKIFINK